MSRWKIVLGLVVVLALVAYALRGPLSLRIMERALPRMMAADPLAGLPDGLHLTLCGAGSPLPDPNRSGPCVGVVAGQNLFVVDAGSGSGCRQSSVPAAPEATPLIFTRRHWCERNAKAQNQNSHKTKTGLL